MNQNNIINRKYQEKCRECSVTVNEVAHRLYCRITEDNMFELYLDNQCIVSQKYWIIKLRGFDYNVEIDGEIIHCVFDEEKLDVALHGKYLKSQKNYIPLRAVYIICVTLLILTPSLFVMLAVGTMDVVVLALSIVFIVVVGIYYKKAVKESKGRRG